MRAHALAPLARTDHATQGNQIPRRYISRRTLPDVAYAEEIRPGDADIAGVKKGSCYAARPEAGNTVTHATKAA